MEISLQYIKHSADKNPTLYSKTKLSLRLTGLTILEQKGILFHFQPTLKYSGIFNTVHSV